LPTHHPMPCWNRALVSSSLVAPRPAHHPCHCKQKRGKERMDRSNTKDSDAAHQSSIWRVVASPPGHARCVRCMRQWHAARGYLEVDRISAGAGLRGRARVRGGQERRRGRRWLVRVRMRVRNIPQKVLYPRGGVPQRRDSSAWRGRRYRGICAQTRRRPRGEARGARIWVLLRRLPRPVPAPRGPVQGCHFRSEHSNTAQLA